MKDSSELIQNALTGICPKRTPIFDLFANDAVFEHFAHRRLDGTDDETVVIEAADNGLDGTRAIMTPNTKENSFTDGVGNVRVKRRWTSWLKTSACSCSDEWARMLERYVEAFENGVSPPFSLGLIEKEPSVNNQANILREQLAYNERLACTMNIHSTPSTAVNALLYYIGLENVSYLWMDHRDLLLRWIGLFRRLTVNYIHLTAHTESAPAVIIYSDIAYKNGLLIGRDMLGEMGFFDEMAQICHTSHERGVKVIFHSDGNIMEILDDVAAAGIDGLNPIEKAAGMDVFELRRKHPELTLVGGVDVTHLLREASHRDIRKETRSIIDETGSEGHLLIGSSTEAGNDIPLDNYLVFHDEVMRG